MKANLMDHVFFSTVGATESVCKWEIWFSYSLNFLYSDKLQKIMFLKVSCIIRLLLCIRPLLSL